MYYHCYDERKNNNTEQLKCNCNKEMPYVFVSYSHQDSKEVHEIIKELYSAGYNVWFDEGIDPGTEWDEFIASSVKESSFFIAFLSKNYLESSNCKDELNFARDCDIERLLVYLEDIELPAGMQMRLGRLQAIYKNKYSNSCEFFDKLTSTSGLETTKINDIITGGPELTSDIQPVIFMVDASGSMTGERIFAVNSIIESLVRSKCKTPCAFAAVTFNSNVSWVSDSLKLQEDFLDSWDLFNNTAGGLTSVGAALDSLNNMLLSNAFFCGDSNKFLDPVILIITDGASTDNWESTLAKLKSNKKFTNAKKISIAIGDDADKEMLSEICDKTSPLVLGSNVKDTINRIKRFIMT